MEKLKFDIEKIKKVPITSVRRNFWNPKDKKTAAYEKVKKGIELKGLRLPIVVRSNNGYEIIDGEQRFTACEELGFKEILIYDEGKISDKEAKELTIWFQQQVPFNEIELAELVKEIYLDDPDTMEVPFSTEEIQNLLQFSDFTVPEYDTDKDFNQEKNEKEEKEIQCPDCGKIIKI